MYLEISGISLQAGFMEISTGGGGGGATEVHERPNGGFRLYSYFYFYVVIFIYYVEYTSILFISGLCHIIIAHEVIFRRTTKQARYDYEKYIFF